MQYTPQRLARITGTSPAAGVVLVAPEVGRHLLIDLFSLSVSSPGAGNFNCLVYIVDDVRQQNPANQVIGVLADVRVPANFGLMLPLIGGGIFQQYTLADPQAAILQPSRRREHLVYPQAIMLSLLNAFPAGVPYSATYRYMELPMTENFCYPD